MPYVSEIVDLAASLLHRLDKLEALAAAQQKAAGEADAEVAKALDYDPAAFNLSVSAQVANQGELFEWTEAFLTAWARLSMLFFPVNGQNGDARKFRKERAAKMCEIFGVDENSPLADRDLRNAWIHFDERLDEAISGGKFGSRQAFVHSWQVKGMRNAAMRLIVVDTLDVHLRTRDGKTASVNLPSLRKPLNALLERAVSAKDKL